MPPNQRGRPPKTEEEKRETKRIYMQKYNKQRYVNDEEYKQKKQKLARDYYNNNKIF